MHTFVNQYQARWNPGSKEMLHMKANENDPFFVSWGRYFMKYMKKWIGISWFLYVVLPSSGQVVPSWLHLCKPFLQCCLNGALTKTQPVRTSRHPHWSLWSLKKRLWSRDDFPCKLTWLAGKTTRNEDASPAEKKKVMFHCHVSFRGVYIPIKHQNFLK